MSVQNLDEDSSAMTSESQCRWNAMSFRQQVKRGTSSGTCFLQRPQGELCRLTPTETRIWDWDPLPSDKDVVGSSLQFAQDFEAESDAQVYDDDCSILWARYTISLLLLVIVYRSMYSI